MAESRALNAAVGWTDLPEDDEAVARGLAASLFGVYFYLRDLIVAPSLQGIGLGELLLDEVLAYLERVAPAGRCQLTARSRPESPRGRAGRAR